MITSEGFSSKDTAGYFLVPGDIFTCFFVVANVFLCKEEKRNKKEEKRKEEECKLIKIRKLF